MLSLFRNYYEIAAMLLFSIGLALLMIDRNMIKKIIGFSMTDSATFLFLAAKGYVTGRKAPIIVNGVQSADVYINPIPTGLVLTGIVVSVASSAVLLALAVRIYRRYRTLDIDRAAILAGSEEDK